MMKIISVGRICYILSLSMALGAFIGVYKWNDALSATCVLGFISLAQYTVGKYFKSGNGDADKKRIVFMLGSAYAMLYLACMWLQYEKIALEVVGGFVGFSLRAVEGFFEIVPTVSIETPATEIK